MKISNEKERIIIAGDSGVIGSYIKKHLNTLNSYEILGLNSKNSTLNNILSIENKFKNEKAYDILIFFIGLAHKKGNKKDFNTFKKINFDTLKNLLTTLKKINKLPKKIIFSSTICIYGETLSTMTYDENTILKPKTPYAKTKKICEEYINKNFKNNSWILRLAPVYSSTFKKNIHPRTKFKKIHYKINDGNIKLSLCNIENIKDSIDGIISNKIPANTYNVSDSLNYTYNDLLAYEKAKFTLQIPKIILYIIFKLNYFINNLFIHESYIKLCSDNIYSSKKINKYIKLNHRLL